MALFILFDEITVQWLSTRCFHQLADEENKMLRIKEKCNFLEWEIILLLLSAPILSFSLPFSYISIHNISTGNFATFNVWRVQICISQNQITAPFVVEIILQITLIHLTRKCKCIISLENHNTHQWQWFKNVIASIWKVHLNDLCFPS